ncbi:Di-sulfide bridge nucleocytoplasmic transport domain-containing protein [Calycina marina]|uniref:Di-sulfide bridge nucleocytoplasmic transport domain-containing protein n=1 Tax=Calycina marina TaxID=1763456 RepID=A0A9P7YVG9_9HELO|nr:Di-sulfide bridge nucleocytoplasmic transport domain-containing protein [Calycina marina]
MFDQPYKRSHETPMDFEWGTGPQTDPNSPFPQFKTGQKKSFESPVKTSFGDSNNSTTAPPFRNPSFTTPRKPFDQELFQDSGADSSPAENTDADAEDTPDAKSITKTMTAFGISASSKKPLFSRYGNSFTGNSPSRGDKRQGKFGTALIQKARKRKRVDRDLALITSAGSDSESEGEQRVKEKDLPAPPRKSWFGNLLDGIVARPNLPNVLSYYAQLILNFTLVFTFIYLLYCFWQAVRGDVNHAADEQRSIVMAEMAACANEYTLNGCHNDKRAPALDKVCNAWDLCMNRDPEATGRAKISARTFAEIFNNFVEPISWKAMLFVLLIITVSITVNNLAFGMFRSKSQPEIHMPHMPAYFQPQPQWGQGVPQTPQHGHGYDIYGNTPYQLPSATPLCSPSKRDRSPSKGNRSPSKGSRSPSKGNRDMVMYDRG